MTMKVRSQEFNVSSFLNTGIFKDIVALTGVFVCELSYFE